MTARFLRPVLPSPQEAYDRNWMAQVLRVIDSVFFRIPQSADDIPEGDIHFYNVPYFIEDGRTFAVPLNKQVLFTLPIELDGAATLDVSGALIEVE